MLNSHTPMPKKDKSPRIRLNAKDRKKQLLKIAISIASEKGLGHARHTDIAKKAGVAVSTVFFYFPTVEILDAEIIEDVSQVISQSSFNSYLKDNTTGSFIDDIEHYIKYFYVSINEQPNYLNIFINWSSAVSHPTWDNYMRFRQAQIDSLTRALEAAIKSGEVNPDLDVNATTQFILANFLMIIRLSYFEDSQDAADLALDGLKSLLKPE